MTVKELKQKLEKYPDNMEVFIAERKTEFTYGLLNSVSLQTVTFMEESDLYHTEEPQIWEEKKEHPKVKCVILDEE